METLPTWRVDLDSPSLLKGGTTVRINVYFGLWVEEKRIDEMYVVGWRVEYGLIKAPTFGASYPYPSFYPSSAQARALDTAVRDILPALRMEFKLPESFDLAPSDIVVQELLIPVKQLGKGYPNVAKANEYQRL